MKSKTVNAGKPITMAVLYGVGALALYVLLYLFEAELVKTSAQGGWFFIMPVAIAFLVSFVHGNFTSLFWDVLGFKAKK